MAARGSPAPFTPGRSGPLRQSQSRLGRRRKAQNTIIGIDLGALFRQVGRINRVVDADGATLALADGARHRPDAVIWATGFRPAYPWLKVPVLDDSGVPIHQHGITDVPGLAFLGPPWQRNRGSALLGWVGRDAALLADRLRAQARFRTVEPIYRPAGATA